jgi:putative FmdB family regulatory protein
MPLFEYRCGACSNLEEVLQKFDDPAPTVCPHCGKKGKMARAVSLTSFQLKGGGWYKDLYSSTPADKSGAESAGGDATPKDGTPKDSKSKDSATPAPAPAANTSASSDTKAPAKPQKAEKKPKPAANKSAA